MELATTEVKEEVSTLVKRLEEIWVDEPYIAKQLKDIIDNAMSPDNKGNLHKDYNIILKALQTLIKMKDKSYWWTNVNLNFFKPPENINY